MANSTAKVRSCSKPECHRKHKARGLCELHYDRAERAGDLSQHKCTKIQAGSTLIERVNHIGWDVVEHNGRGEVQTPCWEWKGAKSGRGGYGLLAVGVRRNGNSQPVLAHRAAHEIWNGPIPDGSVIRHRCDNPPCINPDHLIAGSYKENAQDATDRKLIRIGERSGLSKLSDDDVSEIRRIYAIGNTSQLKLADRFGVSQSVVSLIILNKRRSRRTDYSEWSE